jgi:hypothetical protein
VLAFTLLDKQRMPLADLPAYVDQVEIYRDVNASCLGLSPLALAEMLVNDLEKVGAVRRQDSYLLPR